MTIDNAISDLTELKICGAVPFTKGTISGGNYKVITGDCLDKAIEIMHKYQKMQEILEKVWHVPSCMLDEAECLNKIMETYRTVR